MIHEFMREGGGGTPSEWMRGKNRTTIVIPCSQITSGKEILFLHRDLVAGQKEVE